MGKPVFQFKLDGTFVAEHPSREAAAKVMGCNESSIRKVIDKDKASCGFKWRSSKRLVAAVTSRERFSSTPEIIENLIKYGTEYDPKDVALVQPIFIPETKENKVPDPKHVKILLLDIETAPIRAYVWRLWKQDVGLSQIISDYFMLTWSAKWLNESTVMSERLTGEEAKKEDDKRIVKKLWTLLDDADILIAHNGNAFDIPKINTRFLMHGMIPPSPYKTIDTKLIAKNQFGFSSNKLQHLANSLGIEGKYDTDFELWVRCLQGDENSLEYMEYYNKHDVEVLEEVYLKLRPYAKGHANLDVYFDDDKPHCPCCGGTNITLELNKKFYTQSVEYDTYRCQDCGSISRAKKGNKFANKKTVSAIPR